ncbi:MAG: DMT family transporter [Patescibacteria group bacterium]|jgi:drug/metabolite transporter (DMT)-like permease
MKNKNKTLPSTAILLAGFGYALYGPLSRIVGSGGFGTTGQILIRTIICAIIVSLITVFTRAKLIKIKPRDYHWFVLLSLAAAGTTLFYIPAIINLPLGLTMFLFYAFGTISSYLVGYFLFKESLNKGKVIAFILAIVGLTVMFFKSIYLTNNLYIIFACISGFFYGLYSTFSKKITNKYSLTQSVLVTTIIQLTIFLISWLIIRDNIYVYSIQSWAANIYYAIDVIVVVYLVFYGFKHIEAQIGSLLLLSELVFIIVIGFMFYHEVPSIVQLIGGVLIVLGMIIPQFIKN